MNAGPGVGDFKLAIVRAAGTQTIEAVSFNPGHFQLIEDPSLIHLICKASEIGRMASGSGEPPEWCRNGGPLKRDGPK